MWRFWGRFCARTKWLQKITFQSTFTLHENVLIELSWLHGRNDELQRHQRDWQSKVEVWDAFVLNIKLKIWRRRNRTILEAIKTLNSNFNVPLKILGNLINVQHDFLTHYKLVNPSMNENMNFLASCTVAYTWKVTGFDLIELWPPTCTLTCSMSDLWVLSRLFSGVLTGILFGVFTGLLSRTEQSSYLWIIPSAFFLTNIVSWLTGWLS